MVRKYTLFEIMQWKKKIRHLVVVEHLTKKEACKRIEEEFKAPASTIALYTAPCKYKTPSKYKTYIYPKGYYHYPRYNYPTNQVYNTQYVRIKRNIDKILPQVFNGKPELSLKEISEGIKNLRGVSIKKRTLENLLAKYDSKPRGAPIVKTETGNYQLNPSFYNP